MMCVVYMYNNHFELFKLQIRYDVLNYHLHSKIRVYNRRKFVRYVSGLLASIYERKKKLENLLN